MCIYRYYTYINPYESMTIFQSWTSDEPRPIAQSPTAVQGASDQCHCPQPGIDGMEKCDETRRKNGKENPTVMVIY